MKQTITKVQAKQDIKVNILIFKWEDVSNTCIMEWIFLDHQPNLW